LKSFLMAFIPFCINILLFFGELKVNVKKCAIL
jgi:hypothetical protein